MSCPHGCGDAATCSQCLHAPRMLASPLRRPNGPTFVAYCRDCDVSHRQPVDLVTILRDEPHNLLRRLKQQLGSAFAGWKVWPERDNDQAMIRLHPAAVQVVKASTSPYDASTLRSLYINHTPVLSDPHAPTLTMLQNVAIGDNWIDQLATAVAGFNMTCSACGAYTAYRCSASCKRIPNDFERLLLHRRRL